jgi:hypothetical protein
MKWVHIICILVHIYAPLAMAAPSLLGVCHKDFNCAGVERLYSGQDKVVISWLENTFGHKCQCLERLLNDARPKIIRAHLIQSPCMRNKRCGRYEALWGYTAASASRAARNSKSRLRQRFTAILERFRQRIQGKELTCYVSPCLECDLYEPARRELANLVSAALPTCNIVDNPYGRRCLSGFTCEKHGVNPKLSAPCIVDLDGIDGAKIDVKKWVAKYQHCDLSFYWEPWMNCIRGSFVDPRSRNCRYDKSIFEGAICRSFLPQLSATCLP